MWLLWTLSIIAWVLCESRGRCPGLPVRNSPDNLSGRKATLNLYKLSFIDSISVRYNPHPDPPLAPSYLTGGCVAGMGGRGPDQHRVGVAMTIR